MRVKRWYLYLAPAILVMVALTIYPFVYNIVLSTQTWRMRGGNTFVGLNNYVKLLTSSDFHHALLITAIYLVAIISIEVILGILLAFLLDSRKFFGQGAMKALMLLPMVMAPVVVGLIWRWIFNAEWGLANALLQYIGQDGLPWLTTPKLALVSVIIADIWQWTPFIGLIALAGLQSIPPQLREASRVDGANWFQHQIHISLPFLRSVLWVGLLFRLLDALRLVDNVFVMTYGGPGNATTVLGFAAYVKAFKMWQLGYAAAFGIVLLFVTIFLARIVLKRSKIMEGAAS